MAFDAGMLACTLDEIRRKALGARIEKVYQPERDEIVFQMRSFEGGRRLLINAGSNNPRIGFSVTQKENPQNPPMFCMLLRKHLQGAKLSDVSQADFDRVAFLEFETRDELGFECKRYLIAELMGKYSNLIYADENKKIISALKTIDFSAAGDRQILPGMTYRLPQTQKKLNPLKTDREAFGRIYASASPDQRCDKFITENFMGIAPVVAREISYRATKHTDTPLKFCFEEDVWRELSYVAGVIKRADFSPSLVLDGEKPVEYSFIRLGQYGSLEIKSYEDAGAGAMLDAFFETRDREQRVHQRAADILRLLTNAESRLRRKLDIQHAELADCEKADMYKLYGDLIIANIYRLKRGDKKALLDDYSRCDADGNPAKAEIQLDERLSPAANAQKYYKKYSKAKNARVELSRQIEIGEAELEYIYTVFESLTRAESPTDLEEIRDELYRSGYASRMKAYSARKPHTPSVMKFVTDDGMKVLCGKNNIQNEYVTHRLAEKNDYWFHAKNLPGSHVLLVTEGKEPTDLDFTRAAEIAAYYSKSEGGNIAVDYTLAKNVKKPAGAKPGFVIYHTNWTAYVTPSGQVIEKMRVKNQ